MSDALLDRLAQRRRTAIARAARRSLHAAGAAPGRIVVGCSGGPDSTALLLALAALREPLGLKLHVVSVDHRLRPEAADEACAVQALAERLGLSGEVIAVTVPGGASKMARARLARYAALGEAAQRFAAGFVAVGHTRDDQSESMLMRWLGGAGLLGLCGMAPLSPLPTGAAAPLLLRPLLSEPRSQVDAFLLPLRPLLLPLPFADPSNQDCDYLRTRLRSEALPTLRRLAPHLDAHLLALGRQLRLDAEYLDGAARQALAELGAERSGGDLILSVAALSALPQAIAARVVRLVAEAELGGALIIPAALTAPLPCWFDDPHADDVFP
jgi:tRNA(Ile)-lysidine synthase